MKILIAENSKHLNDIVRNIVKGMSETVLVDRAKDGTTAMSKICNTRYDLIVIGDSLYGMSWVDVLGKIKENKIHSKALVYNSIPNHFNAKTAFELGASGYMNSNSASDVIELALGQFDHKANDNEPSAEKSNSRSLVFENIFSHDDVRDNVYKVFVMFRDGRFAKKCALTVHVG